jgi:hypothetical protein
MPPPKCCPRALARGSQFRDRRPTEGAALTTRDRSQEAASSSTKGRGLGKKYPSCSPFCLGALAHASLFWLGLWEFGRTAGPARVGTSLQKRQVRGGPVQASFFAAARAEGGGACTRPQGEKEEAKRCARNKVVACAHPHRQSAPRPPPTQPQGASHGARRWRPVGGLTIMLVRRQSWCVRGKRSSQPTSLPGQELSAACLSAKSVLVPTLLSGNQPGGQPPHIGQHRPEQCAVGSA